MPAPFNYLLQARDPVDALFQGMAQGDQRRAAAQDLAMGEQTMGIQAEQMDWARQDRARAIQEGIEERKKQVALQQRLGGLAVQIRDGTVSVNDFAAIVAEYPDLAEEMSLAWKDLSEDRKAKEAGEMAKGLIAIKAGRPDLTVAMLEERAIAAENAGEQQDADVARATAAAIKASPESGAAVLGTMLYVVDPDLAERVYGKPPELTASQKDYKFYVDQETAAGRKPLSFNDWDLQSKRAGATTVNVGTTSADGTPRVGVSLAEIQTSVQAATDTIDEIANDPALAKITGSLEGGGGNNVDEFSMARRAYYGDDGLALIQKIAQLQNTAWLAARDMLKGGGAITDYESKKAEGAMARLSRAQGTEEYKAALKDLRDAITEGAKKLQEAGIAPAAGSGSPVDPAAQGAGGDELDALMKEAAGLGASP